MTPEKKGLRWHCAMILYTSQKYKTVNPWDLQTFAGWDEKRRLEKKKKVGISQGVQEY